MRAIVLVAAAMLVIGCAHSSQPNANSGADFQAAKDESDLAEALANRTPEAPLDCVDQRDLSVHKSFGRGAILFGNRKDTVVYLNRPPAGCPGLNVATTIETKTPGTRLCRGDLVTVADPASHVEYGSCALGQFTPYRLSH